MKLAEPDGTTRGSSVVYNIQALRAVAAILIVFVHVNKFLQPLSVPPFGGGGVDIFFVISGYIMAYTTSRRTIGPFAFFLERLARIAPLYWVMSVAVFLIALAYPVLLQGTVATWSRLLMSICFVPFRRENGTIEPILFVGWSLNYEIFFYALFAYGLFFRQRLFGALFVTLALISLTAIGLIVNPTSVVGSFYTSPIIVEFGAGMALAYLYRPPGWHVIWPAKLLTLFSCFGCLISIIVLPLLFRGFPQILVCGLPAVALVAVALALEHWRWTVQSTTVLLLGDASYSIYLSHPFITQTAQKLWSPAPHSKIATLFALCATLAMVCIVGVAVHYVIERPLSSLVRRMLGLRSARSETMDAKARQVR